MKIAVAATGPSMGDQVESRFGRTPYYLFVDPDTMEYEAVQNPNVTAGGGVGIQSAQLMSDRGVQYVLTGNCGPNAFQVFRAAGIQVIVGVTGAVRQAVEQFKAGAFTGTTQANVASHFGMGTGMSPQSGQSGTGRGMGGGRGMGMGGGRGMGMGTGRGMGMGGQTGAPGNFVPQGTMTKEEESAALKEQARMLQEELKRLEQQIDEVNKKGK
jgi:predicted Fe-Mo cluster-binding NifX family protein